MGTRKALYILLEHCIKRKTDCSVWNGKFSVCVHHIIHSSICKAWSGRHLQGTMGAAVLFLSLRPRLPINSDSTLSPPDRGAHSPPGPAQALYREDAAGRKKRE